MRSMRLLANGKPSAVVDIRLPIVFEMEFDVLKPGQLLISSMGLERDDGLVLFCSFELNPEWRRRPRPVGSYRSRVQIPGNFLTEGRFVIGAGILSEAPFHVHCDVNPAVVFQVVDSFDGDAARGDITGQMPGVVRPLLNWSCEHIASQPHSPLVRSAF
jgi:lipopolysaccharide transport system ATP-binding protein